MSAPVLREIVTETAPCPVCGSYTGTTLSQASALLAVCDVLVVRALEAIGKWIIRSDRPRFRAFGNRPWHEAHTVWKPTEEQVRKILNGSWDVVAALLLNHGLAQVSTRQVTDMLDEYVRDLTITGTPHTLDQLRYRFEAFLGIALTEIEPYQPTRHTE